MRLEDQKSARRLRAKGWTLPEIALELSAGKGLVSLWVRDVVISKKGQDRLKKRRQEWRENCSGNGAGGPAAWSRQRKAAREGFRDEGRAAARGGDVQHGLACALYWAEGHKSKNTAAITNSDIGVLRVFLEFCRRCFGIKNSEVCLSVSGYTHVHDAKEMVSYWMRGLRLHGATEVSHSFDNYGYVSKGINKKTIGKLPYGTCTIRIKKSTRIVQHIYGAIEVYGGSVIDPKK